MPVSSNRIATCKLKSYDGNNLHLLESVLRLADFINSNVEPILREWENFARTLKPAAGDMSNKELRNHAALMLEIIARDLRTAQSIDQQIEKSHGDEPREHNDAGHGVARMESDFTIEQLVSEYRALRSSVLRLWAQSLPLDCATDVGDIIRFDESIDQLLAASVFSFAEAKRKAEKIEDERGSQFLHDRKLAEAALSTSEERYRSLFESIDEGFCIIEVLFDKNDHPYDYRFCETNPSFPLQTGLVDAVGKTMREFAPDLEPHWYESYGRVAKTGESVRFQNESKALNRWFNVFAFKIHDEGWHKVAILFTDISEQKRLLETLRRSEQAAIEAVRQAESEQQRLDALLQAAPVGIVVSDANGAFLLSNAAHKHLWGTQEPDPKSIDQFGEWKGWWADHSEKHGRLLEGREWTMARILAGETNPRDIVAIESFDMPPVRRTILITGAPVKDSKGKVVGAVVAQMDIGDRIKAEDALRQADHRKDEFLAMLAHELRNPLAPIAAAADLLGMGGIDEKRIQQTSGIIARQVKHLTALVDDLLDVSRVTRGLVKLDNARLDAKRILSDAVEQARPLIEARRHRLAVHTPPESVFVCGDVKRLVQVITNLLNNAAKYTPEGGDIALSMEIEGGHVKIAVSDNGVGMTPVLQARAFELFAQAARTSDRSQGGLGIGLALVKSLVELHGGSIRVHSDGTGKGSRFVVCLPQLSESETPPNNLSRTDAPAAQTRRLKVLVVDDNVDAAQMLAMLVEASGHQALVEHHPHGALDRAQIERPDVCLLDIGLPDMDGNELARQLRAKPDTARAILIAVTGYSQEKDRVAALNAGFDHYFAKPIDSAKLARLLAETDKR